MKCGGEIRAIWRGRRIFEPGHKPCRRAFAFFPHVIHVQLMFVGWMEWFLFHWHRRRRRSTIYVLFYCSSLNYKTAPGHSYFPFPLCEHANDCTRFNWKFIGEGMRVKMEKKKKDEDKKCGLKMVRWRFLHLRFFLWLTGVEMQWNDLIQFHFFSTW